MGTAPPELRIRGRTAEGAVLREALDRVAQGQSTVVLIEGEAGIGKTRLLDGLLADARGRDMQVAANRAGELDWTRPFGLVAGAFQCSRASLDPRRAAIADLLTAGSVEEQRPITVTSDPGLRFRAVDAFADLAEELSLSGPLVIGADDLQWADPSSLLALAAMTHRLASLPIALIGCLRPSPRGPELDRLTAALRAAGAWHLVLRGLAIDAVFDLVTDTVAAVPGPSLMARVSGAAGNPLFVTELLAALAQEGAIRIAAGRAEVTETTLPPSLRLTILRRLSFLPDDTLQALRAAAVLGSAFSLTDLAVITGHSALDLAVALDEALKARVLEDDDIQLRFRHDLIRDAIYQDLPGSVCRALHHEAGQRLARSAAPALQVAEHLALGAGTCDVEAIGWLTRAAREAAATSPDTAAELLLRAIELMPPTGLGRDRLIAERANSLMWAGRISAAQELCRALLERDHDPGVEGPARLCLGYALVAQSRQREALPELERAATSPGLTTVDRAGARAWAGYARLSVVDLEGASAAAAEVLSTAPADPLATSVAMATRALVCVHRRQLTDALDIIDKAVSLADQSPGREGHRFPIHVTRGFILTELDRLDEARYTFDAGRRIGEELGTGWHLPSYQMSSAVTRYLAGQWDDATAEVDAAQLADQTEEGFSLILGHCVLALIRVHRNELSGAEAAASAAIGQAGAPVPRYLGLWPMWAHASVLGARGRTAEAFALLDECWERFAQLGLTLEARVFGVDLVRLALANGDSEKAHNVAATMIELTEQQDIPSLTGAARHCQGLVDDDVDMLLAAAAAYAHGSRPLELAHASEDAGAAFARQQGMADAARRHLHQAIEIYERLGAARDVARAEAVLRATGVRRGRRGPRGRPLNGWQSLTPTERTVADLVTSGLSNPRIGDRLFISSRTVQTHLAHVFAKLDITSRAQLAALVAQHQGNQAR